MDTKKVLFITSTFPKNKNDVHAGWIGELAVKLKEKNLDVEIFAPSYKGEEQKDYFGVKVHRFRYAPSFLEFLTQDEGAVFKIRRNPLLLFLIPTYFICGIISIYLLIMKGNFDILHVHWPFPQAIFAFAVKPFFKGKIILTFYGAEFALMKKIPLSNYLVKFFISNSDHLTAISNFTKNEVGRFTSKNIFVIPFASTMGIKNAILDRNNKVKQILFVGRLIERKGVKFLISAVPIIAKKFKVHLDIVGRGPLYGDLHDQIRSLNLESTVSIRQNIDNKGLSEIYQKADVFVLPSILDKAGDTEGLGVVLLEAMSFGVPVIGSNVGGITDIIKNNHNGILVKEKNPEDIGKAVISILGDKNLRIKLSKAGIATINNDFSWDKIFKDTLALYGYKKNS